MVARGVVETEPQAFTVVPNKNNQTKNGLLGAQGSISW